MSVVWLDGRLVDTADARVSPFDHGLLVGDGVFETLRVYQGEPFAWTRHHDRLQRSAAGLDLEVPGSAELRSAALAVIEANRVRDGRLRITLTGGPSPLGSERGTGPPTVVIAAAPARPVAPTVDVVIVPWCRNERGAVAGLKTISYAENVRALAYAHERGAGEAVFANTRGELCEATGSNVFVVHDRRLLTPPPDAGCLLGVTRALLLDLAHALGVDHEEVTLPLAALVDADEAFLSSSTREVHPMRHVDGAALPDAPGPVTERLARAFSELVARDLDP